jgi:hypothetical protein
MQRLHFLRWLALAIAVLSLQCLDSLSDDCTKTLTCGNGPRPTLDAQCKWRFPDGGVWETGPRYTPEKRWVWPDGREVADQLPACTPEGDAGLVSGDAGSGGIEGNCNEVGCDAPRLCETVSGRCVTCLDNTQCATTTDPTLGPTPICDQGLHACVACLRNGDCPDGTHQCKTDGSNPARNECVQCLTLAQCQPSETCDPATNECTARCTGPGQCLDPAKPICYPPNGDGLCVQCTDETTCSGATPQCNTTTKQCVPCVGEGVRTGACNADQVCNSLNLCVQCLTDAQCDGETPRCNTATNTCVACLNSAQCGSPTASRCNTASYTCATCNSDAQCESDLPFCSSGRCVSCKDDSQCGGDRCDPNTGTCVNCLGNGDCGDDTLARCDTNSHTCAGCNANNQCGVRFGNRQLCRIDQGTCVECVQNAQCAADTQASRCEQSTGLCSPCRADADCLAFEDTQACAGGSGPAGRCVECTDNTDCAGRPGEPACKVSQQGGNSAPLNTCVQCVVDADCPTAAAARCVANQCTACNANANCTHLAGAGICDTSANSPSCVQCTGQQDDACAPNVCDSRTKICTNLPAGSAGICETCVSDAHCTGGQATGATGRRCALQVFGTTEVGNFCFPLAQTGACPLTPFAGPSDLESIDGVPANVCLLRRTTCPALDDFGLQGKDCATSDACGVDGLDDGVCDTGAGKCSVPCTADIDCQGGNLSCLGSVCQL